VIPRPWTPADARRYSEMGIDLRNPFASVRRSPSGEIPKLRTRVRFSSPAPVHRSRSAPVSAALRCLRPEGGIGGVTFT